MVLITAMLGILLMSTPLTGLAAKDIQVEKSGQDACWFTVEVPEAEIRDWGDGRRMLSLDGYGPEALPGHPALPANFVFVAVPEGARVIVQSRALEPREFSDIRLIPKPKLVSSGTGVLGRLDYSEYRDAYAQAGYLPSQAAELVALESLRQMTVARIRINPVQYDPARGRLRIFDKIEVRVGWKEPQSMGEPVFDPTFDRAFSSMILNYEQARGWGRKPPPISSKDGDPFDQSARWFRIPVLKDGVHRLDYGYLTKYGIDPAIIDPRTIKIFNGGSRALPKDFSQPYPDSLTQVAIWVVGEDDGRFDQDDVIIFYGQDLAGWGKNSALVTPQFHNPYCDTNIYWLGWGGAPGLRMELVDGHPYDSSAYVPASFLDTAHFENDIYNPFNSGELWYWSSLSRTSSEQTKLNSLAFSLPDLTPGVCRVRLSYRAATSGWHRLRWGVNGAYTRDLRWSGTPGSGELNDTSSFTVSSNSNRLDLELVKDTADSTDGLHFNWFEVAYRRGYQAVGRAIRFRVDSTGHLRHRVRLNGLASEGIIILDISDPARPKRITSPHVYQNYVEFEDGWRPGNRYAAAASEVWLVPDAMAEYIPQHLRAGYLDARYLMVVPDELWQPAQRLAQHHASEPGLQPLKLVRLSWVYNEFGFGLRQPAAIRNFLKHVYLASNRTNPAYCLLFGNGNYDYRHRDKSSPNVNLIPSYQGDVLSDPLGEYRFDAHDDWFAHLETSLYPQFAIARLPAMGLSEAGTMVDKIIGYRYSRGGWRNKALFMADDNYFEGAPNSGEWVHTQQTEALSKYILPSHFDQIKIYGCEYPMAGSVKPAAREALRQAWSEGACLVNFIGHGNYFVWGHERYLRGEDVPYLSCGDRLPFVVTASCGISRFDRINYRCIGSSLVALNQGGAIATFGDMREGYSGENFILNQHLYLALFQDSLDLGQSVFTAKYRTQSAANNNRPYVLLGDPGVALAGAKIRMALTPSSDTLMGRGRYTIRGRVEAPGGLASGQVLVRVFDLPKFVDSSGVDYYQPGEAVVQGLASVVGDSFSFNFNMPDLYYATPIPGCRISAYAWGGGPEAAGATADSIWLGGLDTARQNDGRGPGITLWAGGSEVKEGDYVSGSIPLVVRIADPLGVNIAPGVPEGEIRAWLDNEPYRDLGPYFVYDLDCDSSGQASFSPRLGPGQHLLTVRAYDCFGNYSTLRRSFLVADDNSGLSLVYSYPNPTPGGTHFTFQLPVDADVAIKIFTVAGRLIRTIEAPGLGAGYRQVYWDGLDESGDRPANGVYLYRLTMKGAGREDSKYSKIIIMR